MSRRPEAATKDEARPVQAGPRLVRPLLPSSSVSKFGLVSSASGTGPARCTSRHLSSQAPLRCTHVRMPASALPCAGSMQSSMTCKALARAASGTQSGGLLPPQSSDRPPLGKRDTSLAEAAWQRWRVGRTTDLVVRGIEELEVAGGGQASRDGACQGARAPQLQPHQGSHPLRPNGQRSSQACPHSAERLHACCACKYGQLVCQLSPICTTGPHTRHVTQISSPILSLRPGNAGSLCQPGPASHAARCPEV